MEHSCHDHHCDQTKERKMSELIQNNENNFFLLSVNFGLMGGRRGL